MRLVPEHPDVCDYAFTNGVGDAMICMDKFNDDYSGTVYSGTHSLDAILLKPNGEAIWTSEDLTQVGGAPSFRVYSGKCEGMH